MSIASVETAGREKPTVADRVIDAARNAANISHEARLVKSLAQDAIDDGVHAAKRAMKSARRRIERLEDIKEDGLHYVRRQPLKAIAIAAGIGLVVGMAAGWTIPHSARRRG
jgi:ElaB/YqjD/DUF883 family membrane-anchored ribosome-binding protein